MAQEPISQWTEGGDPSGDPAEPTRGKAVAVCVGNRYMRDDGVGPEVAEVLKTLSPGPDVEVVVSQGVDLALFSEFRHAKRLVVVDAVLSGGPPGTVSTFSVSRRRRPLDSLRGPHALGIVDAVDAARLQGLKCPVILVGVEPGDCSPGEGLTKEVASAVPQAAAAAAAALGLGRRSRSPRKAI